MDVVEDAGDTSGRSDVVSDSFEEDLWDYDFSLSASEIASSTKCISLMESAIAFLKVVPKQWASAARQMQALLGLRLL